MGQNRGNIVAVFLRSMEPGLLKIRAAGSLDGSEDLSLQRGGVLFMSKASGMEK